MLVKNSCIWSFNKDGLYAITALAKKVQLDGYGCDYLIYLYYLPPYIVCDI